jgi:hypothetical protein
MSSFMKPSTATRRFSRSKNSMRRGRNAYLFATVYGKEIATAENTILKHLMCPAVPAAGF